jgi:hypothetical protein
MSLDFLLVHAWVTSAALCEARIVDRLEQLLANFFWIEAVLPGHAFLATNRFTSVSIATKITTLSI